MILRIPDKIRKDFYVRTLAERLDIKESILYEMIRPSPRERLPSAATEKKSPPEGSGPKSEEMVIRLMIHNSELIPAISGEKILDEFESPHLKRLGIELETLFQKRGKLDLKEALGNFDEGLRKRLFEYTFQESSVRGDQQKRILKDCIEKIRRNKLKKDENDLLRRIKEVEKQKGGKELEDLLIKHQELAKREKGLLKDSLRKS